MPTIFAFHLQRFRLAYAIGLCLALLLAGGAPVAQSQAVDPAQSAATNAPRDCIDPLKASHIVFSLISLLPLPGFADAADAAAWGVNIALKDCPPEVIPPPNIVVQQPNQGCAHVMSLVVPVDLEELVALERIIMEEIIFLPEMNLNLVQIAEMQRLIQLEYGRFENKAYYSYSNVFGIALPLRVSPFTLPHMGDIGVPRVYHYNSDALVELTYPGTRVSPYLISVPVGNHELVWQGDTLISAFDYIPTFLASSAYRYYKAAQAQAQKRLAISAADVAFQASLRQVLKEGNKFFAKQVAKEIAQSVALKGVVASGSIAFKSSTYHTGADATGVSTFAYQKLTIVDNNKPVISGVVPVTLEAFDPGGLQAARKLPELADALTVTDDCDSDPTLTYTTPRFWPLLVDANGNPLPSAEIIWRASDNGAASAAGGVNTTEVVQQVTVADTLAPILVAPPPVMMYAEGEQKVEVPLGTPQVFDVADLRPTISYDAPGSTPGAQWPSFGRGVHYVTWTATDKSRNSSEPKQQLVNIKAPGTNNPPTANALTGGNTVQAVADVPVKITVTGQDPDVDGAGMRDPIWFRIDQPPDNGFFIAPLYPYFIDDYRITARYSPQIAQWEGEAVALQVAQSQQAMRDYIKDQLCVEDIQRTDLPKDFVSFLGGDQKYVAVDDDGYTYIYDEAYRRCTPGGSTISPTTSPRISVWDPNGLYVGELELGTDGRPLRSVKFNVGQRTVTLTSSDGSSTGNSLVRIAGIQPENANEPILEGETFTLWNEINRIVINDQGDTRAPEYKNAGAAALDTVNNVLYVIGDPNQNSVGMAAFEPANCDSQGQPPLSCLNLLGTPIYSSPIVQSTKIGDYPGFGVDAMRLTRLRDIAVDSVGNVYLLVEHTNGAGFHRIYKFAAATRALDGTVTLGELIGWMGKCTSGPNCNYIEERSIGFACTNETCTVAGGDAGDRPGQFYLAAAIAVDPNDVIYVADAGNQRVQRFSAEGWFAGEARSQSACADCAGFVLGDFGSPGNIAVNSSNFYVLDKQTELVHVFETSVIHSIDNSSAWVEYQSKPNYVGPDSFTFRATDGFRSAEGDLLESAPATVALNVARNFRPPIAEDGYSTTNEDAPVALTLQGYDLDRDLDTLTYAVVQPPQFGALSGNPPNMVYTPGKDFAGQDSFRFTVRDGRDTSEPATFTVEVMPFNDVPEIQPQANSLQAGLGHAVTLNAAILDPDEGEELTAVVNWGDGVVESAGAPGEMGKPALTPLVAGQAELLGYHTYGAAGNYTIVIEVTDLAGAKSTAQVQVNVGPMADLAIQRTATAVISASQSQSTYELTVRNQRASNGQGAAAANVRLTEVLTGSATYRAATAESGSCQVAGMSINCDLGALNPDQVVKVTVQIDLNSSAAPGAVLTLDAEATTDTPDALPENNRDFFELAVVQEADIYVTAVRDGADANPGDGVCATSEGVCTLRAALMEANALPGKQTIALGAGVFVLETAVTAATVDAAPGEGAGDLDIAGDVTLRGVGAQATTIHANGIDRVLEIHSGVVVLEDLTLAGGDAGEGEGGGLLVTSGDVRLGRVSIDGNRAVNGGGILVAGGQLRIVESSLVQNMATGSGGGLYNRQATLTLENVTISANQAVDGGGLIGVGGSAQLLYVTLAGNSATNAGGGINATGNSVRIENSLLAGNSAPIGPDCAPELVSGGHNLVGSLAGCTLSNSSQDVVGQNPGLEDLTVNPAQTYSHPLLPNSQALGRATCVRPIDQGGITREGDTCDVGAYEAGVFVSLLYMPSIRKP